MKGPPVPRLSPGMIQRVNLLDATCVNMRIYLGGGDVGVAEEFLDDAEVGAAFDEVAGEAMPQDVGVDFVDDA